jgi:histone H3/H4
MYWTCNVSTCNRKRTGLVFCSVECWDAHVPLYNHRESWALENRSPKVLGADEDGPGNQPGGEAKAKQPPKQMSERDKFISGLGGDAEKDVRKDVVRKVERSEERESAMSEENSEKEILVVASKLKNYIRAKSGMNTSAAVVDVLSDKLREMCNQAIEAAKQDGRKTVMDRDFG